jgi:hypothetical protein
VHPVGSYCAMVTQCLDSYSIRQRYWCSVYVYQHVFCSRMFLKTSPFLTSHVFVSKLKHQITISLSYCDSSCFSHLLSSFFSATLNSAFNSFQLFRIFLFLFPSVYYPCVCVCVCVCVRVCVYIYIYIYMLSFIFPLFCYFYSSNIP